MSNFAEVVRVPDPVFKACDPRRLMEDVVSLLEIDLRRQGIRVEWEVAGTVPEVAMDRSQMERVFVNLLRNAMEAMNGRGVITVGFSGGADGSCRIRVEDDGPGVPPEVREKLFSPFFSTKPDGQGIGLTLVQEILLRHYFDFSLESRPDRGACFTILCPPTHRNKTGKP
jgi:signal transduction histidine kinase